MIDKTLHGIDMSGLSYRSPFLALSFAIYPRTCPSSVKRLTTAAFLFRMTTLEATRAAAAVPTRPRVQRRIRWIPLPLPGLTRQSMPRPAPCLSARSLGEDPRKDPMAASGLAFGPQRPT
jgi:hypothetical protein